MQGLFSPPAILDIQIGSVPFDDIPRFVSQRVRAKQEPAICTVETANARFGLAWFSGSQDTLPRSCQTFQVVRVDCSRPTPVPQLFRGKTCIVEVVPVKKLGGTIPTRRPCQRGKRVDDQLKIAFACAQGVLGALPVFDIRDQNVPTNKAADAVTRWK